MLNLSIYLAKRISSKESLDSYIKPDCLKKASVHYLDKKYLKKSENTKGKIYVLEEDSYDLSWGNVVNKLAMSKKKIIKKRPGKIKAAILLQIKKRVFILSFGHGVTLIKEGYLEKDFGIKTNRRVLNGENIKSIKSVSLGEGVISNHRFAKKSIPVQRQLDHAPMSIVNDIKGPVHGEFVNGFEIIASGQNQIQMKVNKKEVFLPQLISILEKMLDVYLDETTYRDNFHWENEIKREKDLQKIKQLDKRLAKKIKKMIEKLEDSYNKEISGNTLINIQFYPAIPYSEEKPVLGFRVSGIGYPGKTMLNNMDEVQIFTRLARFLKNKNGSKWPEEQIINKLKRDNVYYYLNENEPIYLEKLYNSIYFETNLREEENSKYILFQGKWYEVPNDFYSYIEKTINDISSDSLGVNYIDFTNEHTKTYKDGRVVKSEGEYNKSMSTEPNMVLFDTKTYRITAEKSKKYNLVKGSSVEPCDLLNYKDDKIQFIHVKIGRSGDGLSHLLNQAYVSSVLLKRDSEFRAHINEEIESQGYEKIDFSNSSNLNNVVVLACIVEPDYVKKKNSNTFPLLTAVGIVNAVSEIRDLGFDCRLIKIPNRYKKVT